MRRGLLAIAVLLLAVVGCSDPTESRLEPGTEVMTYGDHESSVSAWYLTGGASDPLIKDYATDPVAVGVKCRVISDAEKEIEEKGRGSRLTKIKVLEEVRGRETVYVRRANLRPIPAK